MRKIPWRERAFKFWGTALREIRNQWLLRILSLVLKFCSCILWQALKGWQRDGRRLSIKLSVKLPKKRSSQWQLFFQLLLYQEFLPESGFKLHRIPKNKWMLHWVYLIYWKVLKYVHESLWLFGILGLKSEGIIFYCVAAS